MKDKDGVKEFNGVLMGNTHYRNQKESFYKIAIRMRTLQEIMET